MKFIPHTKTAAFPFAPKAVAEFVADIENLPLWTRFFQRIHNERHPSGRRKVETVMGEAYTRVDASHGEHSCTIQINSLIGDREEVATIEVQPDAIGTALRFTLRAPEQLPAAKLESILACLEGELSRLGDVLSLVEKLCWCRERTTRAQRRAS